MRPMVLQALLSVALLVVAGCTAVDVAVGEPQPATWGLAPGQEIGVETTGFVALVTERECASGQSSNGRIVGPEVEYTPQAVIVEFRVRQLGGAQSCPDNPITRVDVRLDEPLGDRVLLDGGIQPPGEPPICQDEEVCQ